MPRISSKRVTLKAIAEQVGCAVSVVSTVLNDASGSTRVGPEMRKQIEGIANKLGYRPNYHARSLRTGRSHAVGLLAARGEKTRFWNPVFAAATDHLLSNNYQVVCLGSHQRTKVVDELAAAIDDSRIDALIMPGFGFSTMVCNKLVKLGIPMVVVAGKPVSGASYVQLDDASGITSAVQHLAELGHRQLLFIGPNDSRYGQPRIDAFTAAAAAQGLRGEVSIIKAASETGSYADQTVTAATAALGRKQRPTGVVCFNEVTAFAVYEAAGALGLRIPEDVSVIGFDDIHAEIARPPMTVVSHMLEELGETAAAQALTHLASPADGPVTVSVPAALVVRSSTAKP